MTDRIYIGELARRTGRTVHAIRWYETQGLMPNVVRDSGGRRVYSIHHASWLEVLERLRRTGMSIADLRAYTKLAVQGHRTIDPVLAMLTAHHEHVRASIAEWKLALKLLDGKVAFYEEWKRTGHRPGKDHAAHQMPTQADKRKPRRVAG